MPRYILPDKKKDDEKSTEAPSAVGMSPVDWQRRITIPVNQAIMDELEVDGGAKVTLTCKVTGMKSEENDNGSNKTVDLEIESVDAYSMNEGGKAFAGGYSEATGRDMDDE